MNMERDAIKKWEWEDIKARYLLSQRLPDCIFIRVCNHKIAKTRWDGLTKLLGQPALEESRKEEELTREPPTATERRSGLRRQRRRSKRSLADITHAADLEGEGCSLAEKGATRTQVAVAEVDLATHNTQPRKFARKLLVRNQRQHRGSREPSKLSLARETTVWSQTCKRGSHATRTQAPLKMLLMVSQTRPQGKKTT
jgi:hypothetical protein